MRTFKTALAVAITFYITEFLNLKSPIFGSIGAITTMKTSINDTFKNIRLRMVTTLIGVLMGFLFSLVTDNLYLKPIVAGMGIITLILILLKLNASDMINLSMIVFMSSFLSQYNKIEYGINRLVSTAIGLVVALVINYTIAPPKVEKIFYSRFFKIYKRILKMTEDAFLTSKKIDTEIVDKNLDEISDNYRTLKKEINIPFKEKIEREIPKKLMAELKTTVISFKVLENMRISEYKLTEENMELVEKIFNYKIIFNQGEEENFEIYNYHINKILSSILEIEKLIEEKNLKI